MRLVLMVVVLLAAGAAQARSDQMFAIEFGGLIASEEACGLAFEEAAIARAIDVNVPADDLSFLTYFEAGIGTAQRRIRDMSSAALVAHCAQVRRLAAHFGLTS